MTPRVVHIGSSLAIVVAAYWTYALLAVPLIEPPANRVELSGGGLGKVNPSVDPLAMYRKGLELLFQPSDWELQEPQILVSDEVKLLTQKYRNRDGGWLELFPLTVVMLPDEPANDPMERHRRAVVLQVPEGASLRFDQPLDLSRAKIGRLIEGRLRGHVTIRSHGKQPDSADELRVETRDVDMAEQRVSTPHPVDFRWGPNYGRGRQLEMILLPRDGPAKGNRAAVNVGGIERFGLQVVERLHLELGKTSSGRAAGAAPNKGLPGMLPFAGSAGEDMPVEITCRGPFHFNIVQQVATFRDQVDVLRIHPTGEGDRLSCELLSIFFTRANQGKTAKPRPGGFDLTAQRIEALGTPATLSAPSDKLNARGERLTYDIPTGGIVLEGGQEVQLQQDVNEIHARDLHYTPAGPGHLGRMSAQGPGWLRGLMSASSGQATEARPPQPVEARWNDHLQIRPQHKNQLISLTGGAKLKSEATGSLEAQAIHFWLLEQPTGQGQTKPVPDRMLAERNVRIESSQLSAAVERLEGWFTQAPPGATPPTGLLGTGGAPAAATAAARAASSPAGPQAAASSPAAAAASAAASPATPGSFGASPAAPPPGPAVGPGVPGGPLGPAAAAPVAAAPVAAGPSPQADPAAAAPRQQHIEVLGRLLQLSVLMHDRQQNEISAITVDGDVRMRETQTALPNEQPMLITGRRVEVVAASRPNAEATVLGEPAHFEARGLGLTGPNIHVQRGTSHVWVDGPGRMDVPMDRDMQGQPLAHPTTMQVDWRGRMNFDGRTAHFEDTVKAIGASQELQTRQLDVRFQQAVAFTEPKPQQQPQVEQVLCRGGVYLENRAMENGRPVSFDRMQVTDLAIHMVSGALTAGGPGWLVSVRQGGGNPMEAMAGAGPSGRPGMVPVSTPRRPNPAEGPQLTGLHLRFMESITGNVHRKEMTFHGKVRAAWAPVTSWSATLDLNSPEKLGPQAFLLDSDHLTVLDLSQPGSGGRLAELLATDNVVAEGSASDGSSFTARSARMTYTQSKELVVLEGDGRSDAELFRQQGPGRQFSRLAARKILYWPRTNQGIIDGPQSLEGSQFPGGQWNNGAKLPFRAPPPRGPAPAPGR